MKCLGGSSETKFPRTPFSSAIGYFMLDLGSTLKIRESEKKYRPILIPTKAAPRPGEAGLG